MPRFSDFFPKNELFGSFFGIFPIFKTSKPSKIKASEKCVFSEKQFSGKYYVLRETIFPFFIPKKGNLFFHFLFPSFALNKFIFFFSPCFLFPSISGILPCFAALKKRSNCAWKQLLLFEKLYFLFYDIGISSWIFLISYL